MQIDQILASFEYFDGNYKRKQIDAALKQQAEITPHLIKILEQVSRDPEKYVLDSNYYAHTYALMLLGHFREAQAHDVIIDLFSLPEEIPFDLFGDIVTENLSVILLRTCGGEITKIQQLVLSQNSNEYCRSAAIEALTYAAITEISSREDVLAFLDSFFVESEIDTDLFVYEKLISSTLDLYATELLAKLISVHEKDAISSYLNSLKSIQKEFLKGKEYCLDRTRQKLEYNSLDDIHKSMDWWYCFQQNKKKPNPSSNKMSTKSKKTGPKTSTKNKKTGTKKKKTFWDL